ncbi:MAG: hypothetical protein WA057_01570 [Candidatus Magasanikiibacteriota bacterium]
MKDENNIIHIDFQRRTKTTEKNNPLTGTPDASSIPERGGKNQPESLSEIEKADFYFFCSSPTAEILINLPTSNTSVSESGKVVHSYSNKELIGLLVNGTEKEFKIKPSFYKAIYLELESRIEN